MKAVTHKGLEVDLVFHEQHPDDQIGMNKGWICHRVEAQVDGKVVGYLKIEYVPSSTFSEKVPSVWHWWSATCHRANDPAKVWFQAHWNLGLIPESLQGQLRNILELSPKKHTPAEDVIWADLEALRERVSGKGVRSPWRDFEDFKRHHMDRPKVAYVRTLHPDSMEAGPDWRRKGIATLLYTEAARWLAREKGLPLWASTLQEDCASATWKSLMASGHHPIRKEPCPWDANKQVPILDYTGIVEHEDHGHRS